MFLINLFLVAHVTLPLYTTTKSQRYKSLAWKLSNSDAFQHLEFMFTAMLRHAGGRTQIQCVKRAVWKTGDADEKTNHILWTKNYFYRWDPLNYNRKNLVSRLSYMFNNILHFHVSHYTPSPSPSPPFPPAPPPLCFVSSCATTNHSGGWGGVWLDVRCRDLVLTQVTPDYN